MTFKTNFLCSLLFILCCTIAGNAQVRFGAKAGLNLSSHNYSGFGIEPEQKLLPGLMLGAVVEFDFSENLGLGTGLQYHGKGSKFAEGDDFKITLNFIQVPLQLQFRSNGFFAAAGPYFAYAIGGAVSDDGDSEDIDFGDGPDDDWSPTDYGINIELGYEFSQVRLTASYGLGLGNGIPADQREFLDEGSVKNNVLGVAVTYFFSGTGTD